MDKYDIFGLGTVSPIWYITRTRGDHGENPKFGIGEAVRGH